MQQRRSRSREESRRWCPHGLKYRNRTLAPSFHFVRRSLQGESLAVTKTSLLMGQIPNPRIPVTAPSDCGTLFLCAVGAAGHIALAGARHEAGALDPHF